MRIIGVDPGPDGALALALMVDGRFTSWAETTMRELDQSIFEQADWFAIEVIGRAAQSKHEIATAETVGRIAERLELVGEQYIRLRRIQIAYACGRPGGMKRGTRYGDAQINRYLRTIYPELDALRPFKQYNHILAACAVAHTAVGKIQAAQIAAREG